MKDAVLRGRAWVFGDDVDTDLIYHNKYLAETDPKKMAQYSFEYYPGKEHFAKEVKPGDFVVAGRNFGTGSSHSFEAPSTAFMMAICAKSESCAAPCQCLTPGGHTTTSPGRMVCTGCPSS